MSKHLQPASPLSPAPQGLIRRRGQRVVSALCGATLLACLQACGGGQEDADTPSASGPTAADLQREWVDHDDDQHLVLPKKGQP